MIFKVKYRKEAVIRYKAFWKRNEARRDYKP